MPPILVAMETTANHCDSCWLRDFGTMSTARSVTSGENFGGSFMAPSTDDCVGEP